MEHAAAQPEDSTPAPRGRKGLRGVVSDIGPKLFITLVAAGISALLIPWITGKWQDHKEQLELRTTIAGEMSQAYTKVIIAGRFVTGGLVYSGSTSKVVNKAAAQSAWTHAYQDWLVASGTIASELTGRYGTQGIASDWHDFTAAVTRYLRLGSGVSPDERAQLLEQEKAYVGATAVTWPALERVGKFKGDPKFRAAYTGLGEWLLGRGDELVQTELRLNPRV